MFDGRCCCGSFRAGLFFLFVFGLALTVAAQEPPKLPPGEPPKEPPRESALKPSKAQTEKPAEKDTEKTAPDPVQKPADDPAAEAARIAESSDGNRFRIESVLTIKREEDIVQIRSQTIFSDNKVFDFIGDNGEIIIYDRAEDVYSLLSPIHRIRTELHRQEVDDFLANIRTALLQENNKFCLFMLNPEFEISKNDEQGEMYFQSKWIDYRIETRRFDAQELADDYFQFSDAYSRLNVYLNPGTLTPLARVKINETLRTEGRFPAKIHQSVYPKGKWLFARMYEFESEYRLVRRLSEDDRGRILRAVLFSRQFPKVSFGKYYQTVNKSDQKQNSK